MSESDLSELFPAMTLEDASVKLKKEEQEVEDALSMMLEHTSITLKKGNQVVEDPPSMALEQISWRNLIGVCDVSSWIYLDKRPSRIGSDRRPSRNGPDKRPSRIGVDKRPSRIGDDKMPSRIGDDKKPSRRRPWRIRDKWFAAIIRYRATTRDRDGRSWLGCYRSPEEAALVYDREAYSFFGPQAILNFPHLIGTNNEEPMMVSDGGRNS